MSDYYAEYVYFAYYAAKSVAAGLRWKEHRVDIGLSINSAPRPSEWFSQFSAVTVGAGVSAANTEWAQTFI